MSALAKNFWPRGRPRWKWLLHTPLTALALFATLCLIARENFPFSNFPMYSRPSAERGYFVVTDDQGNAVPVLTLTGITAPQVGKTYRKKSQGASSSDEPTKGPSRAERDRAIGTEIFQMLRQQASKRGTELPERLQLQVVEIRFEDGQVKEARQVLFAE